MSLFNLFGTTPDESSPQQPATRPTTRSQSRSNAAHLELPVDAVSTFNGIARGRRSPSPLHVGHNANSAVIFTYDSTNVSQHIIQSQAESEAAGKFDDAVDDSGAATASMSSIEELRASAAAAVEAANAATAALVAASSLISQQASQQQLPQIRTRKPELPEFDRKNIDIWLKRVQSAYDRAGISLPRDKFAFLESKFAVGANPSIDAFLYGPATEEAWSAFTDYLREEYGRTVRQEAQFMRAQHSRDGRKPSQMLAHMREKVKRVTVDDILKEIVISSLPANVQQMIAERVKDLSAEETAAAADKYFDQNGQPLHSHSPPIQHIDSSQVELTHEDAYDDDGEINAIGGRRSNFRGNSRSGGRSNYSNNNNRSSKSQFNNASGPPNRMGVKNRFMNQGVPNNASSQRPLHSGASSNASSTANASAAAAPLSQVTLCFKHQRFGDKAYDCQQGCSRWPEWQKKQQGNANAGNRK